MSLRMVRVLTPSFRPVAGRSSHPALAAGAAFDRRGLLALGLIGVPRMRGAGGAGLSVRARSHSSTRRDRPPGRPGR
jgi:hypothetical protein